MIECVCVLCVCVCVCVYVCVRARSACVVHALIATINGESCASCDCILREGFVWPACLPRGCVCLLFRLSHRYAFWRLMSGCVCARALVTSLVAVFFCRRCCGPACCSAPAQAHDTASRAGRVPSPSPGDRRSFAGDCVRDGRRRLPPGAPLLRRCGRHDNGVTVFVLSG